MASAATRRSGRAWVTTWSWTQDKPLLTPATNDVSVPGRSAGWLSGVDAGCRRGVRSGWSAHHNGWRQAVITVVSFIALYVALRLAGGRERGWLRDVLAPEVTNGTLTEAELDALAGHRKDKKAAVRGREDGMSRRREKHVLRAARDLAHDLAVAGGQDSPEVLHSRAEVHRLRGLDDRAAEPAVP